MQASEVIRLEGWLGWMGNGEIDDLLGCASEPLSPDQRVQNCVEPLAQCLERIHGKQVTVRYYCAEQSVTWEEAAIQVLAELLGKASVEYGMYYGDYTGYLYTNEELVIGGHDLLEELKGHVGSYLLLEVIVHAALA